jgi:hypothetical protein
MFRRRALTATLSVLLATVSIAAASQVAPAPAQQVQVRGLEVPPAGVTQELVLRDGTRAFGRVERVDGPRVAFRTTAGILIEADVAQVQTIRVVAGRAAGGSFYAEDPNPTRLFFGPTGRSLQQGRGYVAVYQILLPFVQVGLTDRISVGAGTPILFGGGSEHPFWITPKVQVLSRPSTQAAVGVMHFMNVGDGNLGIAYGAVTQGSTDTAVTVGVGYAYTRTSGEVEGAAIWMIGGEHRVSRRVKVISENYVFSGGGLASFGVRFLGEHLAADLGLVVPLGLGEVIAFPMVNFLWQF